MKTNLRSTFLDDNEVAYQIYDLLANDVLGIEQLEKIKLRYYDMSRNFCNYSKVEAKNTAEVWQFSKGLEPFKPKGWDRYYYDALIVPIPITHPNFKDLTERTEKRGCIGLDLPTWFNLKNNDKRVMLITQDPLRRNIWYSDINKMDPEVTGKTGNREDYICIDALVSSPFALHDRSWREKRGRGGRMRMLVEQLIEKRYGVYLTDCRKYFVYDKRESNIYSSQEQKRKLYKSILGKEIDIIKPECIVAMGNQAHNYCVELLGNDKRLKYVPHFSGLATWKAKEIFSITDKISIEELAKVYADNIIEFCQS